mmetsp:Transcript_111543/g.209236  ORF Transcript_111543/g.209236 Transcript_111543/m.209236 type:complete len:151 (-) Transcript_111543:82-534(-)
MEKRQMKAERRRTLVGIAAETGSAEVTGTAIEIEAVEIKMKKREIEAGIKMKEIEIEVGIKMKERMAETGTEAKNVEGGAGMAGKIAEAESAEDETKAEAEEVAREGIGAAAAIGAEAAEELHAPLRHSFHQWLSAPQACSATGGLHQSF